MSTTRSLILHIICAECDKPYELSVNPDDYMAWRIGQGSKRFVQNAFPYLSDGERELLLSQMCGSCFDIIVPTETLIVIDIEI